MTAKKYYQADVIQNAIDGVSDDCPAENSTIRRWKIRPPDLPRKQFPEDV